MAAESESAYFKPLNPSEQEQLRRVAETVTARVMAIKLSAAAAGAVRAGGWGTGEKAWGGWQVLVRTTSVNSGHCSRATG